MALRTQLQNGLSRALRRLNPPPAGPDDQELILRCLNAYCWALDTGQLDDLRAVFTPDAVLEMGEDIVRGSDAIVRSAQKMLEEFSACQHLVTNHQIDVNNDVARSRSQVLTHRLISDGDGAIRMDAGTFEDDWIRTLSGWRIVHHREEVTFRSP
jgi:hypothetical protein